MTSCHQLTLSWVGVGSEGKYISEEQAEYDKRQIRFSVSKAAEHNAVIWISERGYSGCEDEEEGLLGAVIPAELAKELIEEGRLNHPPLASITVLA